MSVRVGVIGTGVMGAEHARLLHGFIGGASVSAVADIDLDRAKTVAASFGATAYEDPLELITDSTVDAVLIASHDTAHAAQVLACLDAGKPVLCEKPLAPTYPECQSIVRAQAALELPRELVSVGFMRRFHPAFVALREQVRGGSHGAPLLIRGSHRNVTSYPFGGSEGTITNTAVHDIDSTAWMLGSPITEVTWFAGKSTTVDTSRQDPQLIHIRTADGVLTVVDIFLNARYGYDTRYEVVCEEGSVELAPWHIIQSSHALRAGYDYAPDWRPYYADAYRLELQEWVDAVAQERTPGLATAADGARATLVAAALVQSMHEDGGTVSVDAVARSLEGNR